MQTRFGRVGFLGQLALVLLAVGAATPAFADRIDRLAYDFDWPTLAGPPANGGTVLLDPNLMSFGMAFIVGDALTVTSLGYFDYGQDGFVTSHEVGIYDSLGTLVVSATITSATLDGGAPLVLVGYFRFEPITPVRLLPGQYVLAATYNGSGPTRDPYVYAGITSGAGIVTDKEITMARFGGRFATQGDNILRLPTGTTSYEVYAGPNFEIAPEPGTWILLGSALVAGLLLTRRRDTPVQF